MSAPSEVPTFVFKTSKKTGNTAYGYPIETGFLVKAGSQLDAVEKPSDTHYWKPVRDQLRADGIVGEVNGRLEFLRDWPTSSSSRAAGVVYGGNVSGPEYWRRASDQSPLRDWLAKHAID